MLNLVEEEEAGEALNLNIALIPSAHNWEKEANYQYYLDGYSNGYLGQI